MDFVTISKLRGAGGTILVAQLLIQVIKLRNTVMNSGVCICLLQLLFAHFQSRALPFLRTLQLSCGVLYFAMRNQLKYLSLIHI